MTAPTALAHTKLYDNYHNLLEVDTSSYGLAAKEKYFDQLHRLSTNISNADFLQLQSANDLIIKETHKLEMIIDKLTYTAINDGGHLVLLNALSSSLQIVESLIPVAL